VIFAGAGFLPDLEKVADSGQSRSQNPVQPYNKFVNAPALE